MIRPAKLARLLIAAAVLWNGTAEAKGPSEGACFSAAETGQTHRNASQLLAARADLLACSQPSCPPEVSRDCTRWLREVEDALPTVVLGAKDASGNDLTDVHLFVDDIAVGTTREGGAIPLDPGPHRIRFERPGSTGFERSVVLRAGEKNRQVVAELAPSDTPPARTVIAPERQPASSAPRAMPVGSWILGGVGVAGLGVFAIAGLRGVSHFDEFGCEAGCLSAQKSQVDTELRIADIGLVIGVSALVAAAVVYFVRPKATAPAVSSRP